MTSQELMIGDWIKFSEAADWAKGLNGKPVQVAGLCDDDGAIKVYDPRPDSKFRDFWSDDENDFEPIPLTKEILEKNGFTRYGTGYILKGEHFGLDNPSDPNNYLDNYWLRISIKAVHIEFFHELQHALRLCGIEKEIVL